jgi:hypothetical protein
VRRTELEAAFADGWELVAVEPATFVVAFQDEPVRAWRASVRRR